MASPQTENGFTKISNELLEAFINVDLSGSEYKILLAIIRFTYGFHKKEAIITQSQFSEITGIKHKGFISKITNNLCDKQIINKTSGMGLPTSYSINKDYSTWESITLQVSTHQEESTHQGVIGEYSPGSEVSTHQEESTHFSKKRVRVLTNQRTTPYKENLKDNFKENNKDNHHQNPVQTSEKNDDDFLKKCKKLLTSLYSGGRDLRIEFQTFDMLLDDFKLEDVYDCLQDMACRNVRNSGVLPYLRKALISKRDDRKNVKSDLPGTKNEYFEKKPYHYRHITDRYIVWINQADTDLIKIDPDERLIPLGNGFAKSHSECIERYLTEDRP